MADILTLDDGRKLYGASAGISGLLCLIAKELPDDFAQLRHWLIDVSKRPNGMMSIDLRGLAQDHRNALHAAAQRAYNALTEQRELSASHTFAALQSFIQMQNAIRQGLPPEELTNCAVAKSSPIEVDTCDIWDRPGQGDD